MVKFQYIHTRSTLNTDHNNTLPQRLPEKVAREDHNDGGDI